MISLPLSVCHGRHRLNQYATRLRKMRPGADDQRLLGGLAKTLKICNMDPSQLGQVTCAAVRPAGWPLVVTLWPSSASSAPYLPLCVWSPWFMPQAPLAGNALAVTEGLGSRNKPHPHLPFKICLSCHSQLPNAPKEKVYTGAAYGGGFQLFLPGTGQAATEGGTGPAGCCMSRGLGARQPGDAVDAASFLTTLVRRGVAGTAKGPPLRTGTPASPEQVTFSEMPPGSSASPNKKDAARSVPGQPAQRARQGNRRDVDGDYGVGWWCRKQLRSSESSPAPKSNSPRISVRTHTDGTGGWQQSASKHALTDALVSLLLCAGWSTLAVLLQDVVSF